MKLKINSLFCTGLFTAIAASLCCITPVLAFFIGTTSLAAYFSWMKPFRPYLIALTIIVLVFAWYQKLKSKKAIECVCEENKKPTFIQTKTFLGVVTLFAVIMLTFPYYATIFYPKTQKEVIIVSASKIKTVQFDIVGMTCSGCTETVKFEINKLYGIINSSVSYESNNAIVKYDTTKTNEQEIEKAINSTGYKVVKSKLKYNEH